MSHLIISIFVACLTALLITDGVMCSEYKSTSQSNSSVYSTSVSQHFRAFLKCQEMVKHTPDNWNKVDSFCAAVFDGIGCWNAALANTVMRISCPNYISDKAENHAVRRCLANATWEINQTTGKDEGDYTDCEFNVHVHAADEAQLMTLLELMGKLDASPYEDIHTTHAFEKCIDEVLLRPQIEEHERVYCPRTFDGWGCWNDTVAGETAYIPCPNFIQGFSPEKYAHKDCTASGTWYVNLLSNKTWSNYTSCVDTEDLEFRQRINTLYICGYSISLIALLISLAIFFSFKIIWYTTIVNSSDVLMHNGGLYLHTLLVVAFVSESKILKWFYILGWGVPIPMTVVYAILRSQSQDPKDAGFCWIDESVYTWLLSGPVGMSFLLNLFFLINIVRVLVTKLRAVNSPDTHQTRKAVRATLILIPLLGLHFAVTPFRPETKSASEFVYEIVAAIVTSLQGLCVAMLFCFFNGEVISAMSTFISQQMLMRSEHPYKFRSRSLQSTIV